MVNNRFILLAAVCFSFTASHLLAEPADEEFSSVRDKLRAENKVENTVSSLDDNEEIEAEDAPTRHAQTIIDDRSVEDLFNEIIDQIEDRESAT